MYAKPFLKWAGGKYRVLKKILEVLPLGVRFVEPFAGSCAVYLNYTSSKALVNDINADLISLYLYIQREGKDFIKYCQSFFTLESNTKEKYFELRDTFNKTDDNQLRAALLLYLDRHAFNGLVRYNLKGEFNVPFGRYAQPYFPLKELMAFYYKTNEVETEFVCKDFRSVFLELQDGDVVYCDPPYVPLSETANFTTYAGKCFSFQDQQDLASLAKEAHRKGISVVLSNHSTQSTRILYSTAEIREFSVQRFISCIGTKRISALELLAVYR